MGKKRKGINKQCQACSTNFYVPEYRITTAKFCSLKCQNHKQYEQTRLKYICKGCNEQKWDSPSKVKSNKKYCSLECRSKDSMSCKERRKAQKKISIKNRGFNSGRTLRKWIWEFKDKKCEMCNYSEHDYCLDLHHIDHNPDNNTLENIKVLCCMCHRILHKTKES